VGQSLSTFSKGASFHGTIRKRLLAYSDSPVLLTVPTENL
jgi:hypothetical protein